MGPESITYVSEPTMVYALEDDGTAVVTDVQMNRTLAFLSEGDIVGIVHINGNAAVPLMEITEASYPAKFEGPVPGSEQARGG